jgi:hypothetical protein
MKLNGSVGGVLIFFVTVLGGIVSGCMGSSVSGPPSIDALSNTYNPIKNPEAYTLLPKGQPMDWVTAVPGQGYKIQIDGVVQNARLGDMQCLWTPVDHAHKALGPARRVRPADALPGLIIERIGQNEHSFSLRILSGYRFPVIGERLEIVVIDDESDYEERILVIPRTGNP